MDDCVVCFTVKTKAQPREMKTTKQIWKMYKNRARNVLQKKSSVWILGNLKLPNSSVCIQPLTEVATCV